jgi:hypothetical protein
MSGSGQNYSSPNFVIPYSVPSNLPPALLPFLKPIYIGFQNIIQTLVRFAGVAPRAPGDILLSLNDPSALLTNNSHRFYTQASENILPGAAINLFPQLGILFARNANATTGAKPCDGFCSQPAGILAGGIGEVILNNGINTNLAGLVPGSRYFLGTANGSYTTVAPVAAGNLQQSLGIAIDSGSLVFFTGNQVQH